MADGGTLQNLLSTCDLASWSPVSEANTGRAVGRRAQPKLAKHLSLSEEFSQAHEGGDGNDARTAAEGGAGWGG